MSREAQPSNTETKKCPLCKEEIKKDAIKCIHCGTDLKKWKSKERSKIGCGILFGIFVLLFMIASINSSNKASNPASNQNPSPSATSNPSVSVGQNGRVLLPGNNDPSQKICLGTTKDDADAISKALLAKDYLGLLEIPGAFCVSNGSEVLVIEKDFPLTRVRVTKGVSDIDSDKVGLSGWLPFEWVTQ